MGSRQALAIGISGYGAALGLTGVIQPRKLGNPMKEVGKLFEHTLMDIFYAENQISRHC